MSSTVPVSREQAQERILTKDFVLVCLATLAFFGGHIMFFPVLPIFIKRLGGDPSEIGVFTSTAFITSMFFRPVIGQLIDHFGGRRIMMAGAAFYIVISLSYNIAHNFPELLLIRMMTGIALALFTTAAAAYVADVSPVARRGAAMGYFGLANNLAFASGPLIGVAVLTGAWLHGTNNEILGRFGWLSGNDARPENFTMVFLIVTLLAVTATLMTTVLRDHREPAKGSIRLSRDVRTMFTRSAVLPAGVGFCQTFGMTAVLSFLPLLAEERGISGSVRYYFLIQAAATIGVRFVSGPAIDRYGRGPVIVPSLLIMSASLLVTGYAHTEVMLYAGAVLQGIGGGSAQPALMALIVDRALPEQRGRAIATFSLAGDLGLAFGGISMGIIIQHAGYSFAYTVAAVVTAAGLAPYAMNGLVSRRRRGLQTAETKSAGT